MSVLTQFVGGAARVWVSGTSYLIGDVLLSPADNYQQYVRITNGAGATDPSSDSTNYRPYGARAIKSTQRGTINASTGGTQNPTVTITSVNTAKAMLRMLGHVVTTSGTNFQDTLTRLTLTNSTTITMTRNNTTTSMDVSWELTEFY